MHKNKANGPFPNMGKFMQIYANFKKIQLKIRSKLLKAIINTTCKPLFQYLNENI